MLDFFTILKNYGLKFPESYLVNNEEELFDAVNKLNFPVVLKVESPDIIHKSDIGGVFININSYEQAKMAYNNIISSVRKNMPEAKISGVLVQEMFLNGFEIIVGYTNDKVFGPSILLGLGGFFTDYFKEISFRLLPLDLKEIKKFIKSLKFYDLLKNGFRNLKKINLDLFTDVFFKISNFAYDHKDFFDSFDINPIIFRENDYFIVDFKYIPSINKNIKTQNQSLLLQFKPNTQNLDIFFNAKSIAIIGVSNNREKIGTIILENMLNNGYDGKLYPINPKYEKILDIKAYKTLLDVEDKIELVVITLSLDNAIEIIEQCKIKEVKNIVIISGGGKEVGNLKVEEEIKLKAEKANIRIIGCNCLGVYNSVNKIDTMFLPYEHMDRPIPGNISFLTQSGTVGICALESLKNTGVSKFVSYGNRIDVDEADLIEFLGSDPSTKVISCYIEGLEKGRKFFEVCKKNSKNKPIVVYKAGRTPEASNAAKSHTGFLSGTYELFKGALSQANVIHVDSFESLVASSKSLSHFDKINGNRVLIITNGAGVTIQAIDRIMNNKKLKLARLSNETVKILRENLQSFMIIGNPIDLTGSATISDFDLVIKNAILDKNVDLLMVYFVLQCKPMVKNIVDVIKENITTNRQKPIICCSIGGRYTKEVLTIFESKQIPVFSSIEEWVSAAEALVY